MQSNGSNPWTRVKPDNIQQVYNLICGNYCITTDEICSTLPTCKSSGIANIVQLGCSKICAQQVPQMLTDALKEEGKAIANDLLHQHDAECEGFLLQSVTGDEIWIHHFQPKRKQQSMEWCHMTSPKKGET
jgi:hypothetical protein